MDALLRYVQKYIMRIILNAFRIFPVKKNKLLFLNEISLNYSCNPKYIIEYIVNELPGCFDIVLAVADPKHNNCDNSKIRLVKYMSFAYFYEIMTSKVFITNSGGHSFVPKRKGQYRVNTHHGGGAYKKAGLDMFGNTYWFYYYFCN